MAAAGGAAAVAARHADLTNTMNVDENAERPEGWTGEELDDIFGDLKENEETYPDDSGSDTKEENKVKPTIVLDSADAKTSGGKGNSSGSTIVLDSVDEKTSGGKGNGSGSTQENSGISIPKRFRRSAKTTEPAAIDERDV